MDETFDRRATLRITEVRDIFGALLPLGEPLVIHDLSRGGFAVTSPFAFLPGTEHTFAFNLPGAHEVHLSASTVHCERAEGLMGEASYSVGFAFVPGRPTDDLAVAVLADVARAFLPRPSARTLRAV